MEFVSEGFLAYVFWRGLSGVTLQFLFCLSGHPHVLAERGKVRGTWSLWRVCGLWWEWHWAIVWLWSLVPWIQPVANLPRIVVLISACGAVQDICIKCVVTSTWLASAFDADGLVLTFRLQVAMLATFPAGNVSRFHSGGSTL